jgi:uncharacterized protein (TIGR00661 family)
MSKQLKILVSPLDWGLGHATRLVSLLRYLEKQHHHLLIGVNTLTSDFLKEQFPEATFYQLPSYNISYSNSGSPLTNLKLIPKILKAKKAENNWVKNFLQSNKVDLIISDSRFGFHHPSVPSVIISHQLSLQFPKAYSILGHLAQRVNEKWLQEFDQIWVPDTDHHFLSGELSKNKKLQGYYLGSLSRFSPSNAPNPLGKEYILCLLSGPEPQRTKFEDLLLKQAPSINNHLVIIGGKPHQQKKHQDHENLTYFSHLHDDAMVNYIQNALWVVSRSGYSSLMDYQALGCKRVFLVPTPGQTEQIYLAQRMKELKICDYGIQDSLDLSKIESQSTSFTGFHLHQPIKHTFQNIIIDMMTH